MSEITIEQVRSLRKALQGITPNESVQRHITEGCTKYLCFVAEATSDIAILHPECERAYRWKRMDPAITGFLNAAPDLLSIAERALMAQEQER